MRSAGLIRDGEYTAVVEATAGPGAISFGVPFVADSTAPRIRILPGSLLRMSVSEPSVLTLVIDGKALRREAQRRYPHLEF